MRQDAGAGGTRTGWRGYTSSIRNQGRRRRGLRGTRWLPPLPPVGIVGQAWARWQRRAGRPDRTHRGGPGFPCRHGRRRDGRWRDHPGYGRGPGTARGGRRRGRLHLNRGICSTTARPGPGPRGGDAEGGGAHALPEDLRDDGWHGTRASGAPGGQGPSTDVGRRSDGGPPGARRAGRRREWLRRSRAGAERAQAGQPTGDRTPRGGCSMQRMKQLISFVFS